MKQIILMTTFVIIGLMSIGATTAAFAQTNNLEFVLNLHHRHLQIPPPTMHDHTPHDVDVHHGSEFDVDIELPR